MALQVRYFRPSSRTKEARIELVTSFSALSLGNFIPVIRNVVKKIKGDSDDEEGEGEGEREGEEEGEEQGGEQQRVEVHIHGGEDWWV